MKNRDCATPFNAQGRAEHRRASRRGQLAVSDKVTVIVAAPTVTKFKPIGP